VLQQCRTNPDSFPLHCRFIPATTALAAAWSLFPSSHDLAHGGRVRVASLIGRLTPMLWA
jgi:hypothetical protein